MSKVDLKPLERCRYDPAKAQAHPAHVLEIALLGLDDETFNKLQPEHSFLFRQDQPVKTGVKWIDEAEQELFEGEGTQ